MACWRTLFVLVGVCWFANAPFAEPNNHPRVNVPLSEPIHGYGFVDALPGLRFHHPVAIVSQPGAPDSIFIAERFGRIWVVTNLSQPTKSLFLDLSPNNAAPVALEAGLLGLEFHPDFQKNGAFFIFRCLTVSEPGGGQAFFNRLSRFKINPGNPFSASPTTEEILINQRDLSIENHNSGDLHFGPDGYLYVSLGDQGPPPEDHAVTRQPIDKSFFGAILRIDVDQRPGSLPPNPHPSVVGGYRIPPDNPFIGATNYHGLPVDMQQVRAEIYALGFRNPWRFTFHPFSGDLLCGDVGESFWEEINRVEKGGNYGWPYLEGLWPAPFGFAPPPEFESLPPYYVYQHGNGSNSGNAVIGGVVYTGQKLPLDQGSYLFGDNLRGNVWALPPEHDGGPANALWLAGENNISTFGVDPRDQEILVANLSSGKIRKLIYHNPSESNFPRLLSETGLFQDLALLSPSEGLEPYRINSRFWSDNAAKLRWFMLPDSDERFGFSPSNHWNLPEGSIWVKHFEVETTLGDPSSRRRLETRLLVKTADLGYGVVYKWNDEGTDATLLPPEGLDESVEITGHDGVAKSQVWRYPSWTECLACHNDQSGFALGFSTAQLNRPGGDGHNQLDNLAAHDYLSDYPGSPQGLPRMASITNSAYSTEYRVRSYFAANCAQCHQPNLPINAFWNAEFHTPMDRKGLLGTLKIKPGDPAGSSLYRRLDRNSVFRMPPIATSELDQDGLELIADWINGLPAAPWVAADHGAPLAPGNSSARGSLIEVAGYAPANPGASPSGHSLLRPAQGAVHLAARLSQASLRDPENMVGLLFSSDPGVPHPRHFAGVNGNGEIALLDGSELTNLPGTPSPASLRLVNGPLGVQVWTEQGEGWSEAFLFPAPQTNPFAAGFSLRAQNGNQENLGRFEDVQFVTVNLHSFSSRTIRYPESFRFHSAIVAENASVNQIELLVNGESFGTSEAELLHTIPLLPPGSHQVAVRLHLDQELTLDSFPLQVEVLPPHSGAWVWGEDETTAGSWPSSYGQTGYITPAFSQLPEKAEITLVTGDTATSPFPLGQAALLVPSSEDRSDLVWTGSELRINLSFHDELLHQVAFYFADADDDALAQQLLVFDLSSGEPLYQTEVSELSGGKYLILHLRGSVQVRITSAAEASLLGIFIDPARIPPPAIGLGEIPPQITLPAPLHITPVLDSTPLRDVTYRIGSDHFALSEPPFTLLLSNLLAGEYEISAIATDLYFQPSTPATAVVQLLLPSAEAKFLGADPHTKGNWKGAYGTAGFTIVDHATNLPPFAKIEPFNERIYRWFSPWSDPLGLQELELERRVGAIWVSTWEFPLKMRLLDGHRHVISLYGGTHRTRVELTDPATGDLLSQVVMGDLHPGIYYRWAARGALDFKFIRESGAASVNAVFLDPATTYGEWLATKLSKHEIQNENLAGKTADPDQDGLPNLLEYLLGTHPLMPNQIWTFERDFTGNVSFQISLNPSAIDAYPVIEASSDLQAWSVGQINPFTVSQETSEGLHTLRFSIPSLEFDSPKFLRVRVIETP